MSEILVQVRERSIEAVHEGDLKALYELVENYNEELTDEIEQGLYGNILDLALESLTNKLETKDKLSLKQTQEYYVLRALYEYAISHYSDKKFEEAKALFEVLDSIAEEKEFKKAMQIHSLAANLHVEIDSFLDKYCLLKDKMDDFYIKEFKKEAQELLLMQKKSGDLK
jgi:hypothetical protein